VADGDRHLEPTASDRASVQRLLRVLATTGTALMLIVIVSSAYLRLTQAGLSCADWPACYGRVDPEASATIGVRIARLAHRVAASAVGIVLLAGLLIGASQRPWLKRQVGLAGGALAIALGLAALGSRFQPASGETPPPAVMLANFAGGFALLALLWLLRLTTLPPLFGKVPSWLKAIAAVALLAAIGQIVLGALVSVNFAALACPAFPECGGDGSIGAVLQSTHRVGALVVVVLGATLAVSLLRRGGAARSLGTVIAALLVVQPAVGAAMVLTRFPLLLGLAHNAGAALLLVALLSTVRPLYAEGA
jgi:heme a synthase